MREVLKVDLDWIPPENWFKEWISTRKKILEHMEIYLYGAKWRQSSSGKGLHIWFYVTTQKRLGDEDINRLQFLCGDDITRVKINYLRNKRGVKEWNKLFSKVLWKAKPRGKCAKCEILRFLKDLDRKV